MNILVVTDVDITPECRQSINYPEFSEAAILYAQDTQADELANGGTFLWVSPHAFPQEAAIYGCL